MCRAAVLVEGDQGCAWRSALGAVLGNGVSSTSIVGKVQISFKGHPQDPLAPKPQKGNRGGWVREEPAAGRGGHADQTVNCSDTVSLDGERDWEGPVVRVSQYVALAGSLVGAGTAEHDRRA